MKLTVPTWLTLLRIVLIPVLVVVLDGCGLSSFGELAGQFAELVYDVVRG